MGKTKKASITHDLEGNKLTTGWWKCPRDQAEVLARHFHDPEDPRYGEWVEKIGDAIEGEPVKGVLGLIEWTQRELVLAAMRQEVAHAADLLDSWARHRGKGVHRGTRA